MSTIDYKATDAKAYFTMIYVIEALRATDYHTGRKLFEDLEFMAMAAKPEVKARFVSVSTAAGFMQMLRSIRANARNGELPMLHIETHGDAKGIEMDSREFISWATLQGELTAINEACKLNLLVVLAACEGANLMSVIHPDERAAVRGIIGPKRTVSSGEIESASHAFFDALLKSRSVPDAFRAMNDAIRQQDQPFLIMTAEYFFKAAMRQYFQTMCTEEILEQRQLKTFAIRVPSSEHEIEFFRAGQRNHRLHFERFRRRFFFCDRYPENGARFGVTFEDLVSLDKNPSHD